MNYAISLIRCLNICLIIILAITATGCADKQKEQDTPGSVRIISLAPSITEIVCAIGGEHLLVGRTSACDYPEDVIKNVQVVGNFGKPSLETVLAASPTIVLDSALADESFARKMEQMNLNRARVSCRTIDEIPDAIRKVGKLTGLDKNAEKIAEQIEKDLLELENATKKITDRPKVYNEIWDDPLWTTGSKSHLSKMMYLAGATNVGDVVDKDHFQVSHEWVVSRNPDIILCLYMSRSEAAKRKVINRPGWESINAVKNRNVYDGFDNNIILRPGPRIIDGIKILKECINAAD